ncbi:adhesion G protein-coupled receptor E1-like isoform X3 [Dendronephthya gigantea]|uniref:adhesion G protein-coupled receptor E1-like isoform X3 n=1 Tax=Dendronephthya gigantea TaxID=151771 RepID=UPI00106B6949|nr:adhesion G protein-coupled receptor E1-like isoform X3 [Dendronephthya gigantea]
MGMKLITFNVFLLLVSSSTGGEIGRCQDNPCPDEHAKCTYMGGQDYKCDCNEGYKGIMHCTDIDECSLNISLCHDNATCHNTNGSFLCICPPGYFGDGHNCSDIDECFYNDSNCHDNATCENTPGSYVCNCVHGYTGDGHNCSDIDECISNASNCHDNATCKNTPGSYVCSCVHGYTGDGRNCSDIDECTTNRSRCHVYAECVDTEGSYYCKCFKNFTGNGTYCQDECFSNTSSCHDNAMCKNTPGSYVCNCVHGYTGDGRNCSDIDECATNLSRCHVYAECVDTEGSYYCKCFKNFTGNGTYCQDIDECFSNTSSCHDNAMCKNTPGSYVCNCVHGYTGDGRNCSDIDECATNLSRCHVYAECVDTEGSYYCKCFKNFTGNGTYCQDIDECFSNISNCHNNAMCKNTLGSYVCNCVHGYTGDGHNCSDIDECTTNRSRCHVYAECVDTEGSYYCKCFKNFTGNGTYCQDIDECFPNTSNCHDNAMCKNIPGSYVCNCVHGYTGDGHNCSDIDECFYNASNCHDNATCKNTPGSYVCNCVHGYTGDGHNCSDIDECTTNRSRCHVYAECVDTEGSYYCKCFENYTGNGTYCQDVDECSQGLCHPNYGECNNTVGSFECRCLPGFIGDGFNCTDFDECNHCSFVYTGDGLNCSDDDECCTTRKSCHPDADCVNTIGSYGCQCHHGYTGNGFSCTVDDNAYCIKDKSQDITWERTKAGDVQTYSCPRNHLGNCSRKCSIKAIWELPDMSNCVSPKLVELDNQFEEEVVTKQNILQGSLALSNFTRLNSTKLYGGDIITSVRILKHLVFNKNRSRLSNFTKNDIKEFATSYSQTVNNLLETENIPAWEGVKKRKLTALTLVTNVEDFGDILLNRQIEILQPEDDVKALPSSLVFVNLENIELSSKVIDVENFRGFTFGRSSSEGDYSAISFPSSFFGEDKEAHSSGIFNALYRNLAIILNDMENSSILMNSSRDTDIINSVIITAKAVSNKSVSFNNLVDPVILVFSHINQQPDIRHQCSYLNTNSANESWNMWLNNGCSVHSENITHTVCHCSHLTNFALLMDIHGRQSTMSLKHDQNLTVLSYITCSISLISAFVAVLIFCVLRLNSDRILIHKHLALNIFLTQLVFLIAPQCTNIQWLCKAVALCLHFFLLALFFWMLVEGICLYNALIRVFSARAHGTVKKYYILAYGIPLIIVMISGGLYWEKYGTGEKTCWITQQVIISALVPPLGIVILMNAVILGMVIRVLLHPSSLRNTKRNVVKDVRSSLKASITLLPLLGICWIFGFLQLNRDTIVFSYIFVILNGSQGFCFLVFHCLRNNEVKTAWTKRSPLRFSEFHSDQNSSSSIPPLPLQNVSSLSLFTDENRGVQNIHYRNIFGPNDFDDAVLMRKSKNSNVQLKEVKPRNSSNI